MYTFTRRELVAHDSNSQSHIKLDMCDWAFYDIHLHCNGFEQ